MHEQWTGNAGEKSQDKWLQMDYHALQGFYFPSTSFLSICPNETFTQLEISFQRVYNKTTFEIKNFWASPWAAKMMTSSITANSGQLTMMEIMPPIFSDSP